MQIMPRMAKVNYWCMMLLSVAMAAAEIVLHLRFTADRGFLFLLRRMVVSAFMSWSFFALILVLVSIIQLHRLKKGHVETRYEERPMGDDTSPFVPVTDPEPKYRRYIKVAVVGEIILALLYALSLL